MQTGVTLSPRRWPAVLAGSCVAFFGTLVLVMALGAAQVAIPSANTGVAATIVAGLLGALIRIGAGYVTALPVRKRQHWRGTVVLAALASTVGFAFFFALTSGIGLILTAGQAGVSPWVILTLLGWTGEGAIGGTAAVSIRKRPPQIVGDNPTAQVRGRSV